MRVQRIIFLTIFILLCVGCAGMSGRRGGGAGVPQVDAFGVQLLSPIDYREINGVVATEEPCLRGYERVFDDLDLVVGYGFDKKVRKITTRNGSTSICGIKPGMSLEEGGRHALEAGFVRTATPAEFRSDPYSLTFLADRSGKIFGVTLQLE